MIGRLKKNSGQTLLEMVVALAVTVIVIIALATVAVKSIQNAQISKNQTQATRYAQEAIEQVRTVRDQTGWTIFESSVFSCYQVDSALWLLTNGTDCTNGDRIGSTIYKKLITITDDGDIAVISDQRDVTITIFWTDSSGNQSIHIDTKLTKWQ